MWLKGPVLKTCRGRKARENSNISTSPISFEIRPKTWTLVKNLPNHN